MRLALTALLLLFLFGCSGGCASEGRRELHWDGGVCRPFAELTCDGWVRAGHADERQRALCEQMQLHFCSAKWERRIEMGAATLDEAAFRKCLDYLLNAEAALGERPEAVRYCEWPLAPAAEFGRACGLNSDCLTGFCGHVPGAPCRGCRPFLTTGELCHYNEPCDPAQLFCHFPTDGGFSRCEPLRQDGASCVKHEECQAGTCRGPPGARSCGGGDVDAPCLSDAECNSGLFCAVSSPTAPGACAERIAEGSPCEDRVYSDGCAAPFTTCLDGVCKEVPAATRAEGQSCDEPYQCERGLFCKGLPAYGEGIRAGICSPRLTSGERCDERSLAPGCQPNATCPAGQCVVTPRAGQRCSGGSCGFGLVCVADGGVETCQRPPGLNQQCQRDALLCEGGVCDTTRRCGPHLPAGQRCGNAADVSSPFLCESYACVRDPGGGDFTVCSNCLSFD